MGICASQLGGSRHHQNKLAEVEFHRVLIQAECADHNFKVHFSVV